MSSAISIQLSTAIAIANNLDQFMGLIEEDTPFPLNKNSHYKVNN
jgi:hypothetical protein